MEEILLYNVIYPVKERKKFPLDDFIEILMDFKWKSW